MIILEKFLYSYHSHFDNETNAAVLEFGEELFNYEVNSKVKNKFCDFFIKNVNNIKNI